MSSVESNPDLDRVRGLVAEQNPDRNFSVAEAAALNQARSKFFEQVSGSTVLTQPQRKTLLAGLGFNQQDLEQRQERFNELAGGAAERANILGAQKRAINERPGRAGTILSRRPGILS